VVAVAGAHLHIHKLHTHVDGCELRKGLIVLCAAESNLKYGWHAAQLPLP
jgi:hypothetical protein